MKQKPMLLALLVLVGCATPQKQVKPKPEPEPEQKPAVVQETREERWAQVVKNVEISLRKGMTMEEADAALREWAPPNWLRYHKKISVGSWGRHEQWKCDAGWLYLYFENGKLSGWEM